MKELILEHLNKTAERIGMKTDSFVIDCAENAEYGDFTSNIAMTNAKRLGASPRDLAEKIVAGFKEGMPEIVKAVSVAGPGFINFLVKDEVFAREIVEIAASEGPTSRKRSPASMVLIEHTDPNAFKPFHVGHLMANAIGESLSRLISFDGAHVTKICYPSDIGLHIAKSVWAILRNEKDAPPDSAPVIERTDFLGKMYALGTAEYDISEKAKSEIDELNKKIYERSDAKAGAWHEKGKRWSMEHFEMLYKRLGTEFDDYFYESEMAPVGLKIVKENTGKVFGESEGAVVFHGEKYGLHTRVFVNSMGLPTYEAKELGLNASKFKKYPRTDLSIVVTANEQNDYFKVLIKALSLIDENIGSKTRHIGHGMLRLQSGKMSSRTGKVVTGEKLIGDIKRMVLEKMKGSGKSGLEDGKAKSKRDEAKGETEDEIADMVAIGAIKYTILRQAIGGDIIFDSAKSISFEGDSGPYLQYSAVRAAAVLEKAKKEGIEGLKIERSKDSRGEGRSVPEKVGLLERLITRFPDIAERAVDEYAPQLVANYLIALAGEFNGFYAKQIFVNKNDRLSPYYIALTKAFYLTICNGLWLLGIKVPKKM